VKLYLLFEILVGMAGNALLRRARHIQSKGGGQASAVALRAMADNSLYPL
jgi:hypothetical protein